MSRIVYVNGQYFPEEEASISIFDRGFLMADAVYEVTSVLDGKLLEFEGHLLLKYADSTFQLFLEQYLVEQHHDFETTTLH